MLELVDEINIPFDTFVLACGIGTTLTGIATSLPFNKNVFGFAALKGAGFLCKEVRDLLECNQENWSINLEYHFGCFAKTDQKLLTFIEDFKKQTGIPLESVYTGKMMYGLIDLIRHEKFEKGHRIIALHTGCLQGQRSFDQFS